MPDTFVPAAERTVDPDASALLDILIEGVHDGPVLVQTLHSHDGPDGYGVSGAAGCDALVKQLLAWKNAALHVERTKRQQAAAQAGKLQHIVDALAHRLDSHIEQHAADAQRIAELTAAIANTAELLYQLAKPGPCSIDGDGACRGHEGFASGYLEPCPHPAARQFAETWRAVEAGGSES